MKTQLQGPFLGVRWFCADGSIQRPKEYACRDLGGGRQHGQRDERAEAMRAAGIPLANVLAELSPDTALADDARALKAVLVEQYLVIADNGWILRRARYVRGMFQAEEEAAAAHSIMLALARDPGVAGPRFTLLREAVRLLPRPFSADSYAKVRVLADALVERDPDFTDLRNRIHSRPGVDLADLVRQHALRHNDDELHADLETLAATIEAAFAQTGLASQVEQAAAALADPKLQDLATLFATREDPGEQLGVLANILRYTRDAMSHYSAARRLKAIELSLAAEDAAFAVSRQPLPASDRSRRRLLQRFHPLVDALYGTGLITERERGYLQATLNSIDRDGDTTVRRYRDAIGVLARAPGWTANRLAFHLGPMIATFSRVEPRASELIPDRLHESLMLTYGERLETLAADGDRLAGVHHELFGKTVFGGLRVLNPGLARGTLLPLSAAMNQQDETAIVLAPETAATLPPVAGILTESAGNALSHVQLLARNLGLPNVVVSAQVLPTLRAHIGTRIVMAASLGGVVRVAADSPDWDRWFPKGVQKPARLVVDTHRLDLSKREPVPLSQLRATDAGRIVGPKAANLGELSSHYPNMVSPALAIPFGAYRELLDRPGPDGVRSMFDWLQIQYQQLGQIDDSMLRARALTSFLDTARHWFATVTFPDGFVEQLHATAEALFGPDGSYGVYVRSDTNLEDLPGFTGAGLNRTVPNVVGFEAVLSAIRTVWASPFTERAYGWRQLAMDRPEQIYVSVLLHKTVPSEKSGVMVSADPTTSDPSSIFVSANEGAGGAVDGQSAESLRIRLDTGKVDLMSSATEPTRRETLVEGGLREVPASGKDRLLTTSEQRQLADLARSIPERYPQLRDDAGRPAPADVEFAFAGGRLFLLQIRPFLQSSRAQHNALLRSLENGLAANNDAEVNLDSAP